MECNDLKKLRDENQLKLSPKDREIFRKLIVDVWVLAIKNLKKYWSIPKWQNGSITIDYKLPTQRELDLSQTNLPEVRKYLINSAFRYTIDWIFDNKKIIKNDQALIYI